MKYIINHNGNDTTVTQRKGESDDKFLTRVYAKVSDFQHKYPESVVITLYSDGYYGKRVVDTFTGLVGVFY